MNAEGGAYESASRSGDPPAMLEESSKSPQASLKTWVSMSIELGMAEVASASLDL